jgi:hypothetical protein
VLRTPRARPGRTRGGCYDNRATHLWRSAGQPVITVLVDGRVYCQVPAVGHVRAYWLKLAREEAREGTHAVYVWETDGGVSYRLN